MATRASLHPGICGVDLVVPVPANPVREPHNLPDVLATGIANQIGKPCLPEAVVKTRPTHIKDLPNEEKLAILDRAYEVTRPLEGSTVLLVDDLLLSGSTLGHIAALMRAAGAEAVIGFVATKTLRS